MSLISRIKSFFNRKKEAQKAEALRVLEAPIRPAPLEQKPALLTPRMPGKSVSALEVSTRQREQIEEARRRLDEAPVPVPHTDPLAAFYSPFMLASIADMNRETFGAGSVAPVEDFSNIAREAVDSLSSRIEASAREIDSSYLSSSSFDVGGDTSFSSSSSFD